jgi:hypothetical protein
MDTGWIHEDLQSIYRRSYLTESAFLTVQMDVHMFHANGWVIVLVMLDLSAVFDILERVILLIGFENVFLIPGAALK